MVKEVEVVMISEEEDMDRRSQENKSDAAASLSKLESFKFLRVLLVEFDDSTRSIISALLRKSGYRVVSVPDGLKAWELLKGKPQSIDLVLSEVELPCISGFSLLSLIMEDETCRNIPVIMMSQYDAVNIVFKCMLRGAADFLVKPVRKNELRNLWQHVWRRNSGNGTGLTPLDRTPSQQNEEAIDESSSTKNSSSKDNRESSKKDSDANSSCAKQAIEDKDSTQLNHTLMADANMLATNSASKIPNEDANIHIDTFHVNDGHLEPTREAMDLIGSFNNQYNTQLQQVNGDCDLDRTDQNGCSSTHRLELSLKRSHFSDFEVAETQPLKRSTASAFSRYNQQILQSPAGSESKDQLNRAGGHKAEAPQPTVISVPIPVRTQIGYGAAWPQLFYTPLGNLSLQAPNSVTQQEPIFQVCQSDQSNTDINKHKQYNHKPAITTIYKQRHNVNSFDDSRHVAPAAQSYTSSLCNSSSSNFNSSGCGSVCDGSNGNETAATVVQHATTGRSGNDVGAVMADTSKGTDTNSQTQREAALNKFRLKRKDRCFEKKVRYQSRKKLAEQRPRVKGQFVRQVAG